MSWVNYFQNSGKFKSAFLIFLQVQHAAIVADLHDSVKQNLMHCSLDLPHPNISSLLRKILESSSLANNAEVVERIVESCAVEIPVEVGNVSLNKILQIASRLRILPSLADDLFHICESRLQLKLQKWGKASSAGQIVFTCLAWCNRHIFPIYQYCLPHLNDKEILKMVLAVAFEKVAEVRSLDLTRCIEGMRSQAVIQDLEV
jgi:hypothetical protein